MSDTPETDAQQLVQSVTGATLHCVEVEFARKLERDLRKARDTVLKLRKHRAIARRFGEQMERERDEERTITFRQADAIEELERERDEAREIAQDLLEKNAKQAVNIVRWRECAEGLILYAREARNKALADKWEFSRINTDIARFERLNEASK